MHLPDGCQTFAVTGGSVAFDGNGPGSTAVVTCDPGMFADNGDQNMTVTCRSTGQWSYPNPGCSSWFKVFCSEYNQFDSHSYEKFP